MTIGEMIEGVAALHRQPNGWTGETVEKCGCKVCRASYGERGAKAEVVAAAMLGCNFLDSPMDAQEHDGIPQEELYRWYFSPLPQTAEAA